MPITIRSISLADVSSERAIEPYKKAKRTLSPSGSSSLPPIAMSPAVFSNRCFRSAKTGEPCPASRRCAGHPAAVGECQPCSRRPAPVVCFKSSGQLRHIPSRSGFAKVAASTSALISGKSASGIGIKALPEDTKLQALRKVLEGLRDTGYGQTMIFTQFTDTLDFVRDELVRSTNLKILCFSGRGGEVPVGDGRWSKITRDDVRRRFARGEADILLCTDAAAEGLNFQFCGALVNYDLPWNPMRVEQRIGRIDRLGQRFPKIRIVNLHYEDTVEPLFTKF